MRPLLVDAHEAMSVETPWCEQVLETFSGAHVCLDRDFRIVKGNPDAEVAFVILVGPSEDRARVLHLIENVQAGPAESDAQLLLRVLEKHRWQREPAARALGISRTTLWRRMREAGLLRNASG